MSRRLGLRLALLACAMLVPAAAQKAPPAPPASSAIFPDQIGAYERSAPKTIGVPDRALYDEYGLDTMEQAEYSVPGKGPARKQKHFTATAWRLHDSTGALALFQSRRPPGAAKSDFAKLSVRTSDGVIYAYGNYVIQFTGGQPESADLQAFYFHLPKFENSPLPALFTDLPSDGLIPNSERYILGPVSLQRFEPRIPPSVAAFHLGAEAQLGSYKTPKGTLSLIIFNYPTPSMAREQAAQFEKLPGAVVKRTGPLVALALAPPDPDAAERILGKVNYQAAVTENTTVPVNQIKGFATTLLNIFALAGMLICLCVIAGVGFGGFRLISRMIWRKGDPYAMITLHIDKR